MPSLNIYGLLIGIGVVAALEVSKRVAKIRNLKENVLNEAFWWAIIFGIIGARMYHVIDLWEFYSENLINIFYIWNGGIGIWGAILGGALGLFLFWKNLTVRGFHSGTSEDRFSFLSLLDVMVVGVPLAQSIGRWGNYFNNELWGKNGEPIFFYESVANLVLFGVLWKLRKNEKTGTLTGVYLIGYGLIRGSLEWLRPEEIIWHVGSIPTAIIFCLISVFVGGLLICQRRS